MKRKHTIRKKGRAGRSLWYGVAAFLLLPVALFGIRYALRMQGSAQACFTPASIASDGRCLYILNNNVYNKGTRLLPHKNHPCGEDVSAIIPSFHIAGIVQYLDPNYVGAMCAAATPTPIAGSIPTITSAPEVPTATPAQAAPGNGENERENETENEGNGGQPETENENETGHAPTGTAQERSSQKKQVREIALSVSRDAETTLQRLEVIMQNIDQAIQKRQSSGPPMKDPEYFASLVSIARLRQNDAHTAVRNSQQVLRQYDQATTPTEMRTTLVPLHSIPLLLDQFRTALFDVVYYMKYD